MRLKSSFSARLVLPAFILLLCASAVGRGAIAADQIGPQLRAQVEKSRPALGELPAWQEEIFSNEVLPWSSRFVRDYKTSGTQVTKADVDVSGIKRYLSFQASQILKPDANRVLLFVRPEGSCGDCVKAASAVRADLKVRLERRGFNVLIPTGEELGRDPSEAYAKRNASGYVVASLRSEEDADHAGEQRYLLGLDLRFPGTLASSTQKQMEIMPSDSIEVSMSRLVIDAVLEMGGKARTGYVSTATDLPGIEVAFTGISSFTVLMQLKAKLQSAVGSDYKVVEKHIERGGLASLAVIAGNNGEATSSMVSENLRKSAYDGFSVQVLNTAPDRVDARVLVGAGSGSAGGAAGGRS
ncbi:MAG: hypothetical protein H7301_03215 [Cryobacterium sp.]|nr:hypothetical protein [Oligoflexia bacterium]